MQYLHGCSLYVQCLSFFLSFMPDSSTFLLSVIQPGHASLFAMSSFSFLHPCCVNVDHVISNLSMSSFPLQY
jgi:hypothetical protein